MVMAGCRLIAAVVAELGWAGLGWVDLGWDGQPLPVNVA